jgi:hypothetical protein
LLTDLQRRLAAVQGGGDAQDVAQLQEQIRQLQQGLGE